LIVIDVEHLEFSEKTMESGGILLFSKMSYDKEHKVSLSL